MPSDIRLGFVDTRFIEEKKEGDASLSLNEDTEKAILTFPPYIGQILKRAAIRQARSITKSGFLLSNGARVGMGFHLEIQEEDVEKSTAELLEAEILEEVAVEPIPAIRPLEEDLLEFSRFFWEDLYGSAYKTWNEIPKAEQMTIQQLLRLDERNLTDAELQQFFDLRAKDDRELFLEKARLLAIGR